MQPYTELATRATHQPYAALDLQPHAALATIHLEGIVLYHLQNEYISEHLMNSTCHLYTEGKELDQGSNTGAHQSSHQNQNHTSPQFCTTHLNKLSIIPEIGPEPIISHTPNQISIQFIIMYTIVQCQMPC